MIGPHSSMSQAILRGALGLGLFALVTAGVVAGTRALTFDRIADNRLASQYRVLEELLPDSLQGESVQALLDDPLGRPANEPLGHTEPFPAWRAGQGNGTTVILPVVTGDGYSGDIELLVGIDAHLRVTGVRVTRHQETPGLGDKIERRKSAWITDFEGRSLENPAPDGWAVRKEGGQFDAFTGATVTPRAVVGAVRRSLEYADQHYEALFAANDEGTQP